jgi:hypothetical protein
MPTKFKNCKCIGETELARLIRSPEYPFNYTSFWIPYSAIHDDSEVYKNGHSGELVLHDWFCEKKGWI